MKTVHVYETIRYSHVATEALEGHFSYYLQLICYSLIVITYLLMLTWFHIDMPNSDCDILVTTYNLFVIA